MGNIVKEGYLWDPQDSDTASWIQVNLMVPHTIRAVILQGSPEDFYFTETFEVSYSLGDPLDFQYHVNNTTGVNTVSSYEKK